MAMQRPGDADRNYIRELPKNIEAEQVVLGACILEPEYSSPIVVGKLRPEHFYQRRHQAIFTCIMDLVAQDEPFDIVSLANRLEEMELMEKAGGRMYLNELIDRTATTASLEYYAEIVKRKATLREVIELGVRISEAGYDEGSGIDSVLDKIESMVFSVADQGHDHDDTVTLAEYLPQRVSKLSEINSRQDKEKVLGLPTGIVDLDKILGGMHKSDLFILAGRPGTGKSSFSTTAAAHCALKANAKIALFSLEMDKDQVMDRLLAAVGFVNLHQMRNGLLGVEQFRGVTKAASLLVKSNITVTDTPGISVLEIRSKARRIAAENNGLDVIIVDYIQLVEPGIRTSTREQEVAFISRSLKKLARELKCTVIALSQLNRDSVRREDKRPRMEDLRESGAIEQDADVILFVHRPGFIANDPEDMAKASSEVELIVSKQRNGPNGLIHAVFHRSHCSFASPTWDTPEKKDWAIDY